MVITASIQCRELEVSFTQLQLAPWSAAPAQWLPDGGLTSPHHAPRISDEYKAFKPHYGAQRKETSRELPQQFRRLTHTPRLPYRLTQSQDGTITQTCQCTHGEFDVARSVHKLEADSRRIDTFTFTILRCANEKAAGIRVGVCSEDGRRAWMLRISDSRLCDALGNPIRDTGPLYPDLPRFLPADVMGHSVTVKVDMTPRGTSTLYFKVASVGNYFYATRELPQTVRPCVHLTHKGDAVRLHEHKCLRLRDAPLLLGRAATPPPSRVKARYMSGCAPSQRGGPPRQSPQPFQRSLRTWRPESPSATPRGTPRSRTPQTRRAPAPEVLSGPHSPNSPATPSTMEGLPDSDHRCAKCRQNRRAPGKVWCVKCAPRDRLDLETGVHKDWSTTGGDASAFELNVELPWSRN